MKATSVLQSALALLHLADASSSCCRTATKDFHKQVLQNYIAFWNGDYSVANKVLDPAVVVYSDRLPSSTGVGSTEGHITSRDQYVAFVEKSRSGWKEYSFEVLRWTGSDDNLALRWRMHGIVGDNFTLFPTPLKPGAEVSYNGSDFLHMDKCTGLIVEDALTQDLITFFHVMELGKVSVRGGRRQSHGSVCVTSTPRLEESRGQRAR